MNSVYPIALTYIAIISTVTVIVTVYDKLFYIIRFFAPYYGIKVGLRETI